MTAAGVGVDGPELAFVVVEVTNSAAHLVVHMSGRLLLAQKLHLDEDPAARMQRTVVRVTCGEDTPHYISSAIPSEPVDVAMAWV